MIRARIPHLAVWLGIFAIEGCIIVNENQDVCNSDADCAINELCQNGVCTPISGLPTPQDDNDEDGGVGPDGSVILDSGTKPHSDAGVSPETDAGSPLSDAGVPNQDAGVPNQDAGTPILDGGIMTDSGSPPDSGPPSDGGLHVDGGSDGGYVPPFACSSVPEEDLVAYFSFDEDAGAPQALDMSEQGFSLDVSHAFRNQGKSCGGLRFNGVDSHVDLSAISGDLFPVHTNRITVALWFSPSVLENNNDQRLLSKAFGIQRQEHDLLLSFDTEGEAVVTRARLRVGDMVHEIISQEEHALAIDEWYHLALTFDGQTMKLYQDGITMGERDTTGVLTSSSSLATLGIQPDFSYFPYNGLLDELVIYDRGLSQEEIQELMDRTGGAPDWLSPNGENCHPVHSEGAVLQYSFDEVDGEYAINGFQPGQVDGLIVDAIREEGKACGGLLFSGTVNEHVLLTGLVDAWPSLYDAFTIGLWFRADELVAHRWARLFASESAVSQPQSHAVLSFSPIDEISSNTDVTLSARFIIGGESRVILGDNQLLQEGQWTHAAATYDGATLRLFMNGQEIAATPAQGSVDWQDGEPIFLGRTPVFDHPYDDNLFTLAGAMDDVVIYDRALSDLELWNLIEGTLTVAYPPPAPSYGCVSQTNGDSLYQACSTPLLHQDARTVCQSAGMDLVTISSLSENTFLDDWLRSFAGEGYEPHFIGLHQPAGHELMWTNHQPINFTAWEAGGPGPFVFSDFCANIAPGGLWGDDYCAQDQRPFICESLDSPERFLFQARDYPDETSCTIIDAVADTGYSWLHCENYTMEQAAAECQRHGSDLPIFSTESEHAAWTELIASVSQLDLITHDEIWLGAFDVYQTGQFRWFDGNLLDFDATYFGIDISGNPTHQCLTIRDGWLVKNKGCEENKAMLCPIPPVAACSDSDNDGWGAGCAQSPDCAPSNENLNQVCPPQDNICDGLLNPEVPADQAINEERALCQCTAQPSILPADMSLCASPLNWFTARQACASLGMTLAQPSGAIQTNDDDPLIDSSWFGLSSSYPAGDYFWINDDQLSISDYGFSFLQNGDFGCAIVENPSDPNDDNLVWNIADCALDKSFICQEP